MPRNNKCFIHNTPIEVCFRAEEGLPLVSRPFMKEIIKGILAQAQSFYPVKISAMIVMANHLHIIVVVVDPAAVPEFIGYFKRESAHIINKLLGRSQRTVWQNRYDSPLICSEITILKRLTYIYTNPQRAGLVASIEDYPNLSSWNYLGLSRGIIKAKRIFRSQIPFLPDNSQAVTVENEFAASLLNAETEDLDLLIEPYAWMSCFESSSDKDPGFYAPIIKAAVKVEEGRLTAARQYPVIGRSRLLRQNIRAPHTPKKKSQKSIVLDQISEEILALILHFRGEQEKARVARKKLDANEIAALLPPGFFFAGSCKTKASILPKFSPLAPTSPKVKSKRKSKFKKPD